MSEDINKRLTQIERLLNKQLEAQVLINEKLIKLLRYKELELPNKGVPMGFHSYIETKQNKEREWIYKFKD